MKKDVLIEIEQLRARLETAFASRKKVEKEKSKVKTQIVKLQKLVHSRDDWSKEEYEKLEKDAEELIVRDIELKQMHTAIDKDIKSMEERFESLYRSLSMLVGDKIYPYEVLRMLQNKTSLKWKIQWITSSANVKIGYAFVNEKDESYGKPIVAECSIGDLSVDVDNSENRKVVYASMQYDPEDVLQCWDWLDFYLFTTQGVWRSSSLKGFYEDFWYRDTDFAECVCDIIREDLMKTPEEILNSITEK